MKGKHTMLLGCAALGAGAAYLLHPAARPREDAPRVSRRLLQRVRAELKRAVSYPDAIDVHVGTDGRVTLIGAVLMDEADDAIGRIQAVGGAGMVDDRLERYADPNRVAAAESITGLTRRGARRSTEAEPVEYHPSHSLRR